MPIRPAKLEDAHRIAEIHIASWRSTYRGIIPDSVLAGLSVDQREKSWAAGLVQGTNSLLVAEEADQIFGWAAFGVSRDGDPASVAELYAIYIEPNHVRRGIGRQIWAAVMEQLAAHGNESIVAWVLEGNAGAMRFYEKMGGRLELGKIKTLNLGGANLSEVRYRIPVAVGTASGDRS